MNVVLQDAESWSEKREEAEVDGAEGALGESLSV